MPRKLWLGAGIVLALFVVDRVTRQVAFTNSPRTLVPGFLASAPTTNTGVTFGLSVPGPLLLAMVAVLLLVVAVIARSAYHAGHAWRWTAALAIGAGAISNLFDRLEYGYVRDFLKLSFWPTTANLGDWLITFGAIVLILTSMPRRHTRIEPSTSTEAK